MAMQVFRARVKDGAIVLEEGLDLPEGSQVTVVADEGDTALELTPTQEAELAQSIAEAERGDVLSAAELLRRLSR